MQGKVARGMAVEADKRVWHALASSDEARVEEEKGRAAEAKATLKAKEQRNAAEAVAAKAKAAEMAKEAEAMAKEAEAAEVAKAKAKAEEQAATAMATWSPAVTELLSACGKRVPTRGDGFCWLYAVLAGARG